MEYKIERLEMSGSGVKVMWAIQNENGVRQLPTKTANGYNAWNLKRDAKKILDSINNNGIEYVINKLK